MTSPYQKKAKTIMLLGNYFQTSWRNLTKHKLFSVINIFGLAIGLASCLLIMLFVRDETSYDTMWADKDQLYRFQMTFAMGNRDPLVLTSSTGMAKATLKEYYGDDITAVARTNTRRPNIFIGDKVFNEEMTYVDSEILDIFDFEFVEGDGRAALSDKRSVVLNQTMAKKYFGENSPIGETITLSYAGAINDYRVAAVMKDLPHNTHMEIQAMIPILEGDFSETNPWMFASWWSANNMTYFKLAEGVDIENISNRLDNMANTKVPDSGGPPDQKVTDFLTFNVIKVSDIKLYAVGRGDAKSVGTYNMVLSFAGIAILILIIASINFMVLSTARASERAREVAIRKVMGAQRKQLIAQFLGESLFLTFISLLLGLALVEITLPFYNNALERDLVLNYGDSTNLFSLFGLSMLVGITGGVYPALVISSFRPSNVLKANKSSDSKGSSRMRSALVVFQFSVSIALLVSTAVIYGQLQFTMGMDPGYNKDNLLIVSDAGRDGAEENQAALKQQILNLPMVTNASYSSESPGNGNENNRGVSFPDDEREGLLVGTISVDTDFFTTYQIPMLVGRDYEKGRALDLLPSAEGLEPGQMAQGNVIVNRTATRKFGYATPEEALGTLMRIGIGGEDTNPIFAILTIVGVVEDLHFQTLKSTVRPEMYLMDNQNGNLLVRFTGNPVEAAKKVEAVWESIITKVPYNHSFVDEQLAEQYREEATQAQLSLVFSLLAIFVACMGLFGLASFTAKQRTKEIGIRKVMGAGVFDIVKLLLWQFSKPVALANIIAWPIAYYFMSGWLEGFVYRLDSSFIFVFCLLAGVIALAIAWGTVASNAVTVAKTNPIKALRYE